MHLVYGADSKKNGEIVLDGKPIKVRSAGEAIRHGIVLCPEDRKEEGIVAMATVSENINISCRRHYLRAGFFLNRKKEAQTADSFIKLLKIKTPSRRQKIRFLSGGNQQKAILSRWLAEPDLKVVILDEPTRGIDVGAKHEIYNVIYQLAERGCAIVMISSELPEVLGVSDRIVVMRQGRISGELPRSQANEQAVLSLALPQSSTAPEDAASQAA
jgi:L-arabinose transport system ATP-binding protein